MSEPGLWIIDPETSEERYVLYSELEAETIRGLIKPVGGFVFSADLFMRANLPTVPFYVENWLPRRGRCLIYAPAKTGKSYLCLQLSRCVGVGEPFLGLTTVQGTVLYTQFELGEEILRRRLLETGREYSNVWVGTTFSMKLDSEVGQRQLRTAMSAVEPAVLILDPWYKTLRGDENEATDVIRILDFLDELIESFDCSLVIIHHAGKDLSKRGRGSSVLEDWVDSYIQMTRTGTHDETLRVKLKPIFLRHAPLPNEPIEAELRNFEFELTNRTSTVKEQVFRFIESANKVVSCSELFSAGIGSNTSVYEALKSLVAESVIEKVRRGEYKKRT